MSPVSASSQKSRASHRRDIQGLRGVAVALVVAYHARLPLPGGFTGVDVFFVVSGFVITLMLMREFSSTGRISLSRFYSRRIRRLLPALTVMIGTVALLSIALLGPLGQQQLAYNTGRAASLFVGNIQLGTSPGGYFDARAESNPFLHTWSLSVEEQFYLVLPVALWLLWRLTARSRKGRSGPSAVVAAVAIVAAVSALLALAPGMALGEDPTAARTVAFYSALTRGWEFAAGVVLALIVDRLRRMSAAVGDSLIVSGLVFVMLGAVAINGTTRFPGPAALLPVVGASAIIAGGSAASTSWASRLLTAPPLVWIGDISYSWYLWHWPIIVFARTVWPDSALAAPAAALLSLAPAVAAYRLIEQPIRSGKRLSEVSGVRIAVGSIALSLGCLALLELGGDVMRGLEPVAAFDDATRYHLDVVEDCYRPSLEIGTDCVWPNPDATDSVFLIGDSNAGQFTEALVDATRANSYDLVLAVNSGCPPVELTTLVNGAERENCGGFVEQVLQAVARDEPELVILAAASSIYIEDESFQLVDPVSGSAIGDPAGKAQLWSEALESVLREFESAGAEVVVVHPIPHFFKYDGRIGKETCPAFRLVADPADCGNLTDRSRLEEQRSRALDAEIAATHAVASARSVDFFYVLCPDTRCAMHVHGEWLYRDGTHLSVFGTLELTGRFRDLIAGA